VTKLLHEPTRRLREETDPDRCDTYVRVTRDLFGLGPDEPVGRADAPAEDGESFRGESAA
jgi:hypothetical protein